MSHSLEFYETKYQQGEEIDRSYKRKAITLLPDLSKGSKKPRVLDIGCGSGLNALRIKERGYDVYGIDISPTAIKKLKSCGINGQVMDVNIGLDFSDEEFDFVWFTEIIEHLQSSLRILKDIFRVLRPGGFLIMTLPNSCFYPYRILEFFGKAPSEIQHPEHIRFFSKSMITRYLTESGFQIKIFMGRNIYFIFKGGMLRRVLTFFGLNEQKIIQWIERVGIQSEDSILFKDRLYHFSKFSSRLNSLLADTFIILSHK